MKKLIFYIVNFIYQKSHAYLYKHYQKQQFAYDYDLWGEY